MSGRWRSPRAALLVAVGLVPLAGCWLGSNRHPLPATGAGCGAVGASSVGYGRWADGVAVAVWADSDFGYGAGGTTSAGRVRYDGFVTAQTGERVDWTAQVAGPGRGEVVINGVRYDLADGSLFLVAVAGGTVRQLGRDLSRLAPEMVSFEALARDDAELRAFVATAKPPRLGRRLPDPGLRNRTSVGRTIIRPLA